jgi:hypothetical protein
MAFNPFSAFRKHQKVLFAGLTIICMLTFVLTSGVAGFGRDFFSELPRWLGVGRGKNPTVATVFGSRVGERDLLVLQLRRTAALGEIVNVFRQTEMRLQLSQFQRILLTQTEREQLIQRYVKLLPICPPYVQAENGLHKTEELLDFLMWRHMADTLGISFTDADIDALFSRFTDELFSLPEAWASLHSNRRFSQLSLKDFREAVGDELRAQLAQRALLGGNDEGAPRISSGSLATTPAEITPYSFWEYYKKNFTAVNVALLAIPVSDKQFEPNKEPTEREIKSLYNQYKDVEWSPERSTPGFKILKRVKLTWIKAWPEATYYRNLGARIPSLLDDVTTTTAPLLDLMGGGGPAVSLAQAAGPWIPDWRLVGLYESYRQRQQERLRSVERLFRYVPAEQPEVLATAVGQMLASAGADGSPFAPVSGSVAMAFALEARMTHPSVVAAVVADLLSSGGTSGSPFAAPALAEAMTTDYLERRARLCTLAALVGGPSQSPLSAVELAPTLAAAPLPLAEVRSYLAEQLTEQTARDVAISELDSVKTQLRSFHTNAKAREEWLKRELPPTGEPPTYHFKVYRTEQLHTQYSLDQDPEFRQLEEAYQKDQTATTREPGALAKEVIGLPPFVPLNLPSGPAMWKDAEQPIVYWVSEEKQPEVPPLNDETRRKVVEAWKLQQARDRAKQEAQRIVEELKKRPRAQGESVVMPLRDEANKHNWQVFDLNQVSRLVAPAKDQMVLMAQTEYSPYTLPKVDKDRMRYPPPNLADQLLDNLREPGDATLVADQPETTFYVAVLRERAEPSLEQFYEQTYKKVPITDTLWKKVEADRQKEYREAAVKELRIEAGLIDSDGNPKYVIEPEFRKQIESRSREEE